MAGGAEQLGEAAAGILVHGLRPAQGLLGEKAQVSGVELLCKGGVKRRQGSLCPAPVEGG